MPEEEAFICPFCGAPYRVLIPAGTVQVECQYCKSTILVPPRLGGGVQRCPNHPEALAIGLCNDCGKSYCDRCLYVYTVRGGKLHICSECYQSRRNKNVVAVILIGILMFFWFTLFIAWAPASIGIFFLLLIVVFLVLLYEIKRAPITIHDSRQT